MIFSEDTKDKSQKATDELRDMGDDVGDDIQDKVNNLENKFHEQKGEMEGLQDQSTWDVNKYGNERS
ncbi:MAG TPA: hypothetical protein VFM68_04390 [Candidatus Saccharimonadales bacterium]|nr:hypothetical protein [Candidatus Saccharimonadales bacterium]